MAKRHQGYVVNKSLIINAFPPSISNEVRQVLRLSPTMQTWSLPIEMFVGGKKVTIPERVIAAPFDNSDMSQMQQAIYYCIFSRSTNGYVREDSIRKLLGLPLTDWMAPFLFLALTDYVVQVANLVANEEGLVNLLSSFTEENKEDLRLSTARAISFWNLNRYEGIRYESYSAYPPYRMLKALQGSA